MELEVISGRRRTAGDYWECHSLWEKPDLVDVDTETRTGCEQLYLFVSCCLWVVSPLLTSQASEAHRDIWHSMRWQSYPLAHHRIKQGLAGTWRKKIRKSILKLVLFVWNWRQHFLHEPAAVLLVRSCKTPGFISTPSPGVRSWFPRATLSHLRLLLSIPSSCSGQQSAGGKARTRAGFFVPHQAVKEEARQDSDHYHKGRNWSQTEEGHHILGLKRKNHRTKPFQ